MSTLAKKVHGNVSLGLRPVQKREDMKMKKTIEIVAIVLKPAERLYICSDFPYG